MIAERIPQLGVDFHSFDLAEVKLALVKFYAAGYDMLDGLDTNLVVAGRTLLHVKYILTREPCTELPPGFMDLYLPGTCFFKEARAYDAAGVLRGDLDAATPEACQQLCIAEGNQCVAFSFVVGTKKCALQKTLFSKHGAPQPFTVRSRLGWVTGPRECPATGPAGDVIEP